MSKPFGPSPRHVATETFPRTHYPRDPHFLESPVNSRRILPHATCVSEKKVSPCVRHCWQPSTSSVVRKGTLLNSTSIIPRAFHTIPQPSCGGHIISVARPHASMVQPSLQSLAAGMQPISHSFHPNGAVQVENLERNWFDNGELCGTTAEYTGSVAMRGVRIGVDGQQQEMNDALQSDNGCVGEDVHLLTPEILRDASLLQSTTPDISDKSVLYNGNWSPWDMIEFNGILIDESEIVCQWAGPFLTCNEHLQVKNIRNHLARKHGVQSNSLPYRCSWNECSVGQPMTCSSLARHIRERHSFVKWACPTCDETFTREYTLLGHLKSCSGRSALQVWPQH